MHEKYKLPDSPRVFVNNLIEKAPNDLPSLKKLIGINKIMYSSKESMSAAVADTRPYTLIFGKKFCETHFTSDEDAIFVLFHELTHLVLDHFAKDVLELFEEKGLSGDNLKTIFAQQCTHIVVDAQVNATCYHTLKDDKYMEFPCRFYSLEEQIKRWGEDCAKAEEAGNTPPPPPEDAMPFCLLHPKGEVECPDEFKPLHRKLYSEKGISNSELIDALLPWFKNNESKLPNVVKMLLGNHKDIMDDNRTSNSENLSQEDKEFLESILDDLESKSKDRDYQKSQQGNKDDKELDKKLAKSKTLNGDKEQPKRDYSLESNPVKLYISKLKNKISVNKDLTKILVTHYKPSPAGKLSRAIDGFFPKSPKRTVIPNFHNRRTSSLFSQGITTVFNDNPIKGVKNTVACYIDVSGSQEHVVPKVVTAVLRYKKLMGNFVYCFSTEVEDVHVKMLNKHFFSYGGTNFNSVMEHILQNKFKNVIILTDGCANLSEHYIQSIKTKKIKIAVGWTESSPSLEPLSEILDSQFWLFND